MLDWFFIQSYPQQKDILDETSEVSCADSASFKSSPFRLFAQTQLPSQQPNSQIEIDIPLIGYFSATPQPDRGLTPDILVEKTVEDLLNGVDTELKLVTGFISKESESK